MSHGCTLETDDGSCDLQAQNAEADREREITAASGELSRRWRPADASAGTEVPAAGSALPAASAVETVRARGYVVREAVFRLAGAPLAWPPYRVRLLVLTLFITVIIVCGVIAVAAYALALP